MLQMDRDRFWFEAWFRYAWNPDRDEKTEKLYWAKRFAEIYKLRTEQGEMLRKSLEAAGRCAPKILGRVGITEGNRQSMSLGMTMSELTNVNEYRPNLELWKSVARKGEQPDDWIRTETAGREHIGETPFDMVDEVEQLAGQAYRQMQALMGELGASGR